MSFDALIGWASAIKYFIEFSVSKIVFTKSMKWIHWGYDLPQSFEVNQNPTLFFFILLSSVRLFLCFESFYMFPWVVLTGFAWFLVVGHGFVWFCMVLHGSAWFCVVLHDFVFVIKFVKCLDSWFLVTFEAIFSSNNIWNFCCMIL